MGFLYEYNDGNIIGNYWKVKEVFIRETNLMSHAIICLYPHKTAYVSGVPCIYERRIMWCNCDFFLTESMLETKSTNTAIYERLRDVDMIGGLIDVA